MVCVWSRSVPTTPTVCARPSDGRLWALWFTAVPEPDKVDAYINTALEGQRAGHMHPWAVRELTSGRIIGSTRYHDIVAAIDRVEIGYTWYAKSWQRTHVNTACKLLLFQHAFESVGCAVVGLGPTTSTSPHNAPSSDSAQKRTA